MKEKMIKKATFGKTENVIVVEFGLGYIQMIGSEKGEDGVVVLGFKDTEESHKINKNYKSEYKSYDEMKPDIVFRFSKLASIYSLINQLKALTKEFKKFNK